VNSMFDDDPEAPWIKDLQYGGMTPASARKSYEASLVRQHSNSITSENSVVLGANPTTTHELALPASAEEAIAQRFVKRHASEIRYIAKLGRWFMWTGQKWKEDETLQVADLAREVCRKVASECRYEKRTAIAIASAKTVNAIEKLSKSDRALAATVEQFDAEPMLLNTPGGRLRSKKRSHPPA
jgi:phage/plasmid-associated DNA primase